MKKNEFPEFYKDWIKLIKKNKNILLKKKF